MGDLGCRGESERGEGNDVRPRDRGSRPGRSSFHDAEGGLMRFAMQYGTIRSVITDRYGAMYTRSPNVPSTCNLGRVEWSCHGNQRVGSCVETFNQHLGNKHTGGGRGREKGSGGEMRPSPASLAAPISPYIFVAYDDTLPSGHIDAVKYTCRYADASGAGGVQPCGGCHEAGGRSGEAGQFSSAYRFVWNCSPQHSA